MISRVPRAVRRAAREAFTRREPGVGVADLVFDSLLDLPVARPSSPARCLRFEHPLRRIDVEVRATADGLVVDLRCWPPEEVEVEVRQPGTVRRTRCDRSGQVRLRDCVPGLVSVLLVPAPSQPSVRTAWVQI